MRVVIFTLFACAAYVHGCTMMLAGRKATVDGSTMTTQTNDCFDCDFRLGIVPRAAHGNDSKASIWPVRFAYPRYVGEDRSEIYQEAKVDKSIYPWTATPTIGTIDQVPETYQYLDGSYPIVNDKQLGFGESTCGSYLVSKPVHAGGKALFDISALVRVAIERTSKARDAVALMGALAEEYGYYGAVYEGASAQAEAGEALGVIDTEEAWMFHIVPDDSGASACWVAKKLAEDELAVVANQFIIRNVDLRDTDNFMGSSNMEEVAVRAGLWNHKDGSLAKGTFDWTKAYAMPRGHMSPYATRRVWSIYRMAAPSLVLPGDTTELGDDYPFSVKPDKRISAADLMRYMRDHYEGTPYDLTTGIAGGPYGDPSRFDPSANADGVTTADSGAGKYERAISLYRASYTFVVVCRSWLPDSVGAMAWVGYYAPHASIYVPFYPASPDTPTSFSKGSLYALDRDSGYWGSAAAGNYGDRFYKHTIGEFVSLQRELEGHFVKQQAEVEAQAVAMLSDSSLTTSESDATTEGGGMSADQAVASYLRDFTAACASAAHSRMWGLLDHLITKYHDGVRLDDFHASTYNPTKLFYPMAWLKQSNFFPAGYFGDDNKDSTKTTTTSNNNDSAGDETDSESRVPADTGDHSTLYAAVGGVVLGLACGVSAGMAYQKSKHNYQPIN